jgi:hypothetical protein
MAPSSTAFPDRCRSIASAAEPPAWRRSELPHDRYAAIVRERYHFVVLPGHEEPQIERIVKTEGDFLIVEKIGDAREQIDRDHPQRHHRGQKERDGDE